MNTDAPADYDDSPVKSPVLAAIKGIIIAAVITLIVFGGLALYNGYNTAQPEEVLVPDFVGMNLNDANIVNNGKFVFEYESRYSDEFEVDTIIYQTPEAGSKKIKEGSTIELVINSAETDVTVPYVGVTGSVDKIVEKIKEVNLVPVILYVNSEAEEQSIDSIFPEVGTQVNIGSTVYVFVSKGPAKGAIEMPDLSGLSATEAQAKLNELGIEDVSIAYDEKSKEEKDKVIRQNPVKGSKIDADYGVVITCSKGEKEKKEATIYVDMPTSVNEDVEVTVLVDGKVDSANSKTLNPSQTSTYTLKIKGKDKVTVLVRINGKDYREYSIDYEEGYVTTVNSYDYVVETTAPETSAPTVAETQAVEE